jgi:hypothetical protein
MIPQEEAVQIFAEVVGGLSARESDLKFILRRCLHACQMLGWKDSAAWFQQELIGYVSGAAIPAYRQVAAKLVWQTKGVPFDQFGRLRAIDRAARQGRDGEDEDIVVSVPAGSSMQLKRDTLRRLPRLRKFHPNQAAP